jgi:excinuclease ABC subunit A
MGNTVIVVEHEEEVIRAADYIVDIGPDAGENGGRVVYSGDFDKLDTATNSYTADYILGRRRIEIPATARGWSNYLWLKGCRQNNLKNISVKIPLGVMTCVTGVSGSGKSSLVRDILYPALRRELADTGDHPGDFDGLSGDVSLLRGVEMVDQNPIGKSSRSNPAIYIKAWDEIRKLFAEQPYAKHNGITASYFSFNAAGGRCEVCHGEGSIKVGMQFMADITLTCEACGGRRFKDEVLEVKYRDKSVCDILDMSVDEAIAFFRQDEKACRRIVERLQTLSDVGLGYLTLGQPCTTLSGGESQRIKLAAELSKTDTGRTLYILDEPTTGLHFEDIRQLLSVINKLVDRGNTAIVIEHNLDVIKVADHLIDIGPEGGAGGGEVIATGRPADIAAEERSATGKFLRQMGL